MQDSSSLSLPYFQHPSNHQSNKNHNDSAPSVNTASGSKVSMIGDKLFVGHSLETAQESSRNILKLEGNIPFKEELKVCALLLRQLMIVMNNWCDVVHWCEMQSSSTGERKGNYEAAQVDEDTDSLSQMTMLLSLSSTTSHSQVPTVLQTINLARILAL